MPNVAAPAHRIVIGPVDHYTGPRLTRRQWQAGIAVNESGGAIVAICEHTHGHKTISAAQACGARLYKIFNLAA